MRTNGKRIITLVAIVALVAVLGVCLAACNSTDYANRLAKKGYSVEAHTYTDSYEARQFLKEFGLEADEIAWYVSGNKEWMEEPNRYNDWVETSHTESVTIIKFNKKDRAQEYYDDYRAQIRTLSETYPYDDNLDLSVDIKGKVVIVGTRQGVSDAK